MWIRDRCGVTVLPWGLTKDLIGQTLGVIVGRGFTFSHSHPTALWWGRFVHRMPPFRERS